jgi:hypothetical protein
LDHNFSRRKGCWCRVLGLYWNLHLFLYGKWCGLGAGTIDCDWCLTHGGLAMARTRGSSSTWWLWRTGALRGCLGRNTREGRWYRGVETVDSEWSYSMLQFWEEERRGNTHFRRWKEHVTPSKGFSSTKLFLENPISRHFALRPLIFSKINIQPTYLHEAPRIFKNISKIPLASFQKLQIGPWTSFHHIITTVTPNSVTLSPEFLEALPLSFYAFI